MATQTTKPTNNTIPKFNKNRSNLAFAGLENGKLPPQAVELEATVLGALMLEKEALSSVIDILKPEAFYKEAHKKIFEAILELFHKSEPVDILTVTQQLRKMAMLDYVGGPYYISQLSNRVSSSLNSEYHAKIILQKHIARELIRTGTEQIQDAYEDTTDVFELLDKSESNLFKIGDTVIVKSYERMSSLTLKLTRQMELASQTSSGGITGVPCGLTDVDRLTGGWQPSDLIIIAARPGMGKTALVLSMAKNMAVDFKNPTAIFSLEMASIQLVARLASSETGFSGEKIKRGELSSADWEYFNKSMANIADAPLYIDDTAQLSVYELRAKARRLVQQNGVKCIIIDYLQLMTTSGGSGHQSFNREQEISTISRSLKALAKELSIPIIALSQLSRQVEQRGGDKRPQLSDLRESGAIEQDADMVMFIYRPEYYGLTEDANQRSTVGVAQLIVAKNRHGKTTDIDLRFKDSIGKFCDISEIDHQGTYDTPLSNSTMRPSADFLDTPTKGYDDKVDSNSPF